jgi:DNA-binding CsgD family transcriptional regulator
VFVRGLTRLVNAQIAAAVEIGAETQGHPPRLVQIADCGWLAPVHRENWDFHYTRGQKFRRLPVYQRFAAFQGALNTKSREQLVPDAEWYRSVEFNVFHRSMGIDDILPSLTRTDDPPGLLGFVLLRGLGRERFGAGERRLARLFHGELIRQVGTSLARTHARSPHLPPRLQQTLDCLLEGDSEKQAALRLRLSPHTVHEYVKALYRRLGVSTRAGLMALCLRGEGRVRPGPPHPPAG